MPISGPSLTGPAPLNDLLSKAVSGKPQEWALTSGDHSWTWRDFQRDVDHLAAQLIAMGLTPGQRVASLLPNCGELLIFYLACFKAGLVATPLNYRYTPANIDYALGFSDVQLLFFHAERQADIADSQLAGGLPKGLISLNGALQGVRSFESLLKTEAPEVVFPQIDVEATALIFFTSGSTGKPKGVMHSIASFGSIAASFSQALKLTESDIVFPGGSISHVGSLSTAFAALSAQAPIVLDRGFDADAVLPVLRQHRPTVIVALPAALIAFLHDHKATREDFSSVRLLISGGDKFPLDIAQQFAEFSGTDITESYGLTEATDSMLGPVDAPAKPGSVGHVCPGFSASIRDDQGREVREGNLWLAGRPVCQGYWNNPEENAKCFVDGWFDTGDVMAVDDDGYFWFKGRTKQIIVHDGSNIAPQEVEEAVMCHPAVDLAGAVGVRNEMHGENVWVFVTLKSGARRPQMQQIIEVARKQIGYKAPEMVRFLDEMPLNVTGKIDRMTLKKMAAEYLSAHPLP
ncbi:MAG: class I adenylate-forming enzyme family protein [Pseudomonadota bacterium]